MMRWYVRRIDDGVTEPAILAVAALYDAIGGARTDISQLGVHPAAG